MLRGSCPKCNSGESLYLVKEISGLEKHCTVCGYIQYLDPEPNKLTNNLPAFFRAKRDKVEKL